jgi:hypothetical protein
MGKIGRRSRAEKKKLLKKQAKAARRALYASYAGTGRRAKKRAVRGGPTAQRGNHAMSNCGNIGCEACFPQFRCRRQNEFSFRGI